MDQSILNHALSQLYTALYPDLFKKSLKINLFGVESIDFDAKAPPIVNLSPSDEAKSKISAEFDALHNDPKTEESMKMLEATDKSALLHFASLATFSAVFPNVTLVIHHTNKRISPTTVRSTSITTHATVAVDGSNLTFKILDGKVHAEDKTIQFLLNRALIPPLLLYLNNKVLKPIVIHPIQYKSLHLSAPLAVVQDSCITAFSTLGSTPTSASSLSWPRSAVYVVADTAVIEEVAKLTFPLGPYEHFEWKIFSGQVGATLNAPSVSKVHQDGSLDISMDAQAICKLTAHFPWPIGHVSFDPKATAQVKGKFLPTVDNKDLSLKIEHVSVPNFYFHWGIPGMIDKIFKPFEKLLAEALNATLGKLINKAIEKLAPIDVYTIPDILLKFPEKTLKLSLQQGTPSGFRDSMLLITGSISVSQ